MRIISMNVMGIDLRPRSALAVRTHRRRWSRLFDALACTEADAVGVQELFWSGQRGQFLDRMSRARYQTVLEPSSPWRPGGLGLAVRGRIVEHASHTFRARHNLRSRWVRYGALAARVEIGGRVIDLAVTHLEAGGPERGRAAQAAELLAWLAERSSDGTPLVLLGDLNAPPEAPALAPLLESLRDACDGVAGHTWGWNELAGRAAIPERLDYILHRPGDGLVARGAGRVCDASRDPLSDHCGLEVEFAHADAGEGR